MSTPSIVWPPVRDGKISGVLSMYVSVDRTGHVRETWPLNSDNARLDDSARAQVMKWQFKPLLIHSASAQVESIFTFAFDMKTNDTVAALSDSEVRKLASHIVEAVVAPGIAPSGTAFTVRISVDANGKLEGVDNINKLSNTLFMAAYSALEHWRFQSYLRNGKPDEFKGDITFRVP